MVARAFQSASASPATVPASPLPSKNPTGGGLGNLQWLFMRKRRANKVQHGRPIAAVDHHHQQEAAAADDDDCDDDECASMFAGATPYIGPTTPGDDDDAPCPGSRKRRGEALWRLRSAILAVLARARRGGGGRRPLGSCATVTGTIFGRRRGRVHLALQTHPRATPALLVELAAYSTGALVREMASGLVRLALECQKTPPSPPQQTGDHQRRARGHQHHAAAALLEEDTWRAYCNGRKCGYAVRRDCGAGEWRVLRAVETVSVGAGVLPDGGGGGGEGDLIYMRARFERVVGSRDSEAFYMLNPDGGSGPELSIYLLRVQMTN